MGRIKLWIERLLDRPFFKDAESSSGSSPDTTEKDNSPTTPQPEKKQWKLTRYLRHLGLGVALIFNGKSLLRCHGEPVDKTD